MSDGRVGRNRWLQTHKRRQLNLRESDSTICHDAKTYGSLTEGTIARQIRERESGSRPRRDAETRERNRRPTHG